MMSFMRQFIRHYLLAVQFFTRIPVTGQLADWVGFSPAMLRASAAHFPGVGVLVGALLAAFTWALQTALPHNAYAPLVAAVLGTAWGVLLTGAFHEDGLADVADGLGGTLAGLSGAPVLDRQGRAVGVTIAESPRRGRIYTTSPDTFGPAIRGVQKADEPLTGRLVTVDNYGLVADDLRRDLRVAQVVCLSA
jgi:hypothetical protein